jgi:hypothetical protein
VVLWHEMLWLAAGVPGEAVGLMFLLFYRQQASRTHTAVADAVWIAKAGIAVLQLLLLLLLRHQHHCLCRPAQVMLAAQQHLLLLLLLLMQPAVLMT